MASHWQMADLIFPSTFIYPLHGNLAHSIPSLKRLVVANSQFADEQSVRILLCMPQLDHLVTDSSP
jgi:hypothetical protein